MAPIMDRSRAKTWVAGSGTVADIAFSPDGETLAAATWGKDPVVKLWSLDGRLVQIYRNGASAYTRSLCFSRDGRQLLASDQEGFARLYGVSSGKLERSWNNQRGPSDIETPFPTAAHFCLTDGSGVATADAGLIKIFDRTTGKPVRSLRLSAAGLAEFQVSPDGSKIEAENVYGTIKVWDACTGKELPYKDENAETGGGFSNDGSFFWGGLATGGIERHDLATGSVLLSPGGSSLPIHLVQFQGGTLLTQFEPGWWSSGVQQYAWRIDALDRPGGFEAGSSTVLSPDGNWALVLTIQPDRPAQLWDIGKGRSGLSLDGLAGAVFSPDSARLLAWHDDGTLLLTALPSGKPVWAVHAKGGAPADAAFFSQDGTVIGVRLKSGDFLMLDAASGKSVAAFGSFPGARSIGAFSPVGTEFALTVDSHLHLWREVNGKLAEATADIQGTLAYAEPAPIFSANGKTLIVQQPYSLLFYDVQTGKQSFKLTEDGQGAPNCEDRLVSPTKPWALELSQSQVIVWDYLARTQVAAIDLKELCKQAFFTPDGSRIITVDGADGVTAWSLATGAPVRTGSFQVGADGEWLAMDEQGRYDARNPARVMGANYVLAWDGGLEPIDVSQLKSEFYEPGLLAKMLGIDSAPLRSVPDLKGIHLYPSIQFARSAGKVLVTLADRDGGGIGRIGVFFNGKEVAAKEGDGYFEIDPADYVAYMLPATELNGHGNVLAVQAANEDGSLVSHSATLDLGIPASLQTPPIHLYGLCVGVGIYAGSGRLNLASPPGDASAIGRSLALGAQRLFPGQVEVTALASKSPQGEPTKKAIEAWFAAVARKATSSDIVFVFFAGHGTDEIGGKHDYFFLTSEADPTDVTAATAVGGAISGSELRGLLGRIAAQKQVVILDTCHSGAAAADLVSARSTSGDYQRAWEAIKDATGTWLLAGAAADQASYESGNVDHGVLTYALLESIDQELPQALRQGEGGRMFLDVERWLGYAVDRVDSLRAEIGVSGIQHPELRRSDSRSSFDLGMLTVADRGAVGLKPPMPIVLVGPFDDNEEDPLGLEKALANSLSDSHVFKPWFDIAKRPNMYRVVGRYEIDGDNVHVQVYLQRLNSLEDRTTISLLKVNGARQDVPDLASSIRKAVDDALSQAVSR